MQQLQYDSFYKFMVSAGTVLVVAPIALILYLVFGKDDLLISQARMASLCSESAELVYSRFKYLSYIYKWAPAICLVLILVGSWLIYKGCKKWWEIQKKLDQRIYLEVDELDRKVQLMTQTEVEKKTYGKVKETIIGESHQNVKNYNNMAFKYQEVEDGCFRKIYEEKGDTYLISQNVSIGRDDYDIVCFSRNDSPDLIYEVKYWNKIPSKGSTEVAVNRLIRKKESYEAKEHRIAKPILMIVTTKENIGSIKTFTKELDINKQVVIRIEDEQNISPHTG